MGVSCAWKMTLEFAGALISFARSGMAWAERGDWLVRGAGPKRVTSGGRTEVDHRTFPSDHRSTDHHLT